FDKMAGFIVQNYKNIRDALGGHTQWLSQGKPVYSIIVTLEDWWIFDSVIVGKLDAKVREKMVSIDLDLSYLSEMPYTVASIDELELAVQAINANDIASFMNLKNSKEHKESSLGPYVKSEYSNIKRKLLFPMEWEEVKQAVVPS